MDKHEAPIQQQISNCNLLIMGWIAELDMERRRWNVFKFLDEKDKMEAQEQAIDRCLRAIKYQESQRAALLAPAPAEPNGKVHDAAVQPLKEI